MVNLYLPKNEIDRTSFPKEKADTGIYPRDESAGMVMWLRRGRYLEQRMEHYQTLAGIK